MKRSMAGSAVLASIWLAGCASGVAPTPTSSTPASRAGGIIAAPPSGGRDAKASPVGASQGPLVNPCSVVTRRALSIAFGTHAPAGRRTGTKCDYAAGTHGLQVNESPADAAIARALRRSISSPQPNSVPLSEPGFNGVAQNTIATSQGAGAQAEISFIKGQALVILVLTDTAKRTGSLIDAVIALGRTTARGA